MTRWQLTPDDPLALQLAADARLSQTDYLDDQAWELALGAPGSPALALQTNYGGRVGLASLVPLWRIDNRPIYEYQAYANPPVITTFAPGYAQATAKITPRLALRADFWVIDSHTVGARLTVRNSGAALDLGFDLIGFAAAQGKELKLSAFPLPGGGHALTFGKPGNINPVVVLEGGRSSSPNTLSADFNVPANGQIVVRWVHAALPPITDSLAQAQNWLRQNWKRAAAPDQQSGAGHPRHRNGRRSRRRCHRLRLPAGGSVVPQADRQPAARLVRDGAAAGARLQPARRRTDSACAAGAGRTRRWRICRRWRSRPSTRKWRRAWCATTSPSSAPTAGSTGSRVSPGSRRICSACRSWRGWRGASGSTARMTLF
ncbi:MAG: hypothetical protein U0703_22680 [Anaerolineae bacterium]